MNLIFKDWRADALQSQSAVWGGGYSLEFTILIVVGEDQNSSRYSLRLAGLPEGPWQESIIKIP